MKKLFIILLASAFGITSVQAKTKKFGTWLEAEFSKDIVKRLEFSFTPEVRLQDDFSVDEYMAEFGLTYKPFKFLNIGSSYRLSKDIKNSGTETFHRFAIDATGKKEFGRFESSLRLRYTNYSENEDTDLKSNFFRPKVKLVYDIKGLPIAPYSSYELFYDLTNSQFDKSRFDIGATWQIFKKSRVGVYYRLQSEFSGGSAIHILGMSYKLAL
jgi:hypothetical protein